MHFTDIIYIVISKISKIRQKYKNNSIVKKAQARLVTSYLISVLNLEAIRLKLFVDMHSIVTIYYTVISKFQKFAKNQK